MSSTQTLVFILQNHHTNFTLDLDKIYRPNEYVLCLITNYVGYRHLQQRKQVGRCSKIIKTENFSFDNLKQLIEYEISVCQGVAKPSINIVTGADQSVSVCGRLRKHFEIEGDNFQRYTDKLLMKKQLKDTGINIPKHFRFDKVLYNDNSNVYLDGILQALSFPIFAKPIDQAGSFGVEKLKDAEGFHCWAEQAVQSPLIFELDECIEGILYHADSFIKDHKIQFTQVCENINPCYEFMNGKPQGSFPLKADSPLNHRLQAYTHLIIETLKPIQAGVTHLEFFLRNDGSLVFLEISCRPAGGSIPKMYLNYLSVDLHATHILLQIQKKYSLSIKHGNFTGWISYPQVPGKIQALHKPNCDSQCDIIWKKKRGDLMRKPTILADEVCTLVLSHKDYDVLLADIARLKHFTPYSLSCRALSDKTVIRN